MATHLTAMATHLTANREAPPRRIRLRQSSGIVDAVQVANGGGQSSGVVEDAQVANGSSVWARKKQIASNPEATFDVVDGIANLKIPDEIFDEAELLWKSFVVGYFIGDAPHIGPVHATVNRIWSSPKAGTKIDVQFIEKNTVLFRIENP
ncbi:hypothetical protein Rs2_40815 [Raphanus sativus]|nr:hypothetical protein Rs2_40815 [Raphanus sativus]